MPNTRTTLVALFKDVESASQAKNELLNEGYSDNDIYLASSDATTMSGSDAATGNTALTGTTASAHSSGGGLASWFRSVFGADNDESDHYAHAVAGGAISVSVTTDETRADRAVDILNRYGAIDIDEQSRNYSRDTLTTGTSGLSDATVVDQQGATAIPIMQEELAVGKRMVTRGGVRVVTSMSERPVEEQVTLRDETVRVERRAVDRPATQGDFASGNEVIEVSEVDEEAVVGKQARVVEEVLIGKETTQRQKTIRDTVRRTEVEVENLGNETDTTKRRT